MRPPLSSRIRSVAGVGAVLLIAACAAVIMAMTHAKLSKVMQRPVPDSMLYHLKLAGTR